MKKLVAMLSVVLATGVAYGQSLLEHLPNESAWGNDTKVRLNVWADQFNAGVSNAAVNTFGVSALVVSNALTAAGGTVGDVNVGTNLDIAVTAVTGVTNGQFITLSASSIEINNTGQASVTTTNPVATPYATALVGRLVLLQAAAVNTDSIHVAESAMLALTATNLTLTANDVVVFYIAATNLARQVSAVTAN